MKKLIIFLLVIFFISVYIMPANAAIKKVAQTGFQFLKIDMGARAAAMGGSFSMVGEDASAMFYNPAGMAMVESNFDFFASRTEWITDVSYSAGGLVKNFGKWGKVGVSFVACDYGEIIGTRVAATEKGFEETGMVDVGAYAVGIAYARRLTNKFSIGGQVKYTGQHLGDNLLPNGETVENETSGFAYDFGTIFYPGFKSFRLGMNIRNFSSQFKYEKTAFQLPLTFTLGFAMDVLDFMGEHKNPLLISIDAIHPRDYTERTHIGAEYVFMDMFAFRGGYKFNYDEEGLTAGFGFNYNLAGFDMKLDYSYSDFGIFDAINRFSFGFSF